MLVLSRKKGESLIINGSLAITVLDVAKGKIKLGIEAPAEVAVRREEVAHVARNSH